MIRYIYKHEGPRALMKGLGPIIVGVVPSRAVYFWAYNHSKTQFSNICQCGEDRPMIHIVSASLAGVCTATAMNPIWMIKTRLQLHSSLLTPMQSRTTLQCIREIVREEGFKGFFRGLGASYVGISEGVLQFVVYEQLKLAKQRENLTEQRQPSSFQSNLLYFVVCSTAYH